MKKVLLTILVLLVVVVGGLFLYISLSWDKTWDAPYPGISATTDSAMIARGEYLVNGPAHCIQCHIPEEKLDEFKQGKLPALTGGIVFDIPPGKFRTPNLTPDPETGIGNLSDAEIARAMRYSVSHRDRVLAPFMPFQDLSDEDLTAVISYLRSLEPVKHEVKPTEYTFLGKAVLTFGLLKPVGPTGTPPVRVRADTTAEYGAYLAHSVANCVGCHTARDLKTGEFTGPEFAGGMTFVGDPGSMGYKYISPNITPDGTSAMNGWNEIFFVERFKGGRLEPGSPMPWEAYARMTDNDLKALWNYLQSLEPRENRIAQTVFGPDEELPE